MFIGLPWSTMQKRKKKIVLVLLMGMFMFLVGGIKNFPFFFPPSILNTPLPPLNMSINKTCVGEERKKVEKRKKIFFVSPLKRKEKEGDKPYSLYIIHKLAGVLLLLIIIFIISTGPA